MKRARAVREGDRVRIIVPKVVIRVGYPKEVKDYLETARNYYGAQLRLDMSERCAEKALWQIAYGFAKADGFGGRERSLHFQDAPDLEGQEFTVTGVRMVQTGTYYPPHASVSYWGEHDYTPGGLENMKARRLVTGFQTYGSTFNLQTPELPVEHVERVIES